MLDYHVHMHRVQKLMSNYGFCSRRKAEEYISEGKVKVNGKKITLGDKASEKDVISVNGKDLNRPRKIYLMLNKPLGCVTALSDPTHRTVMHYIKCKERVFPVGRLDYNTSGILIFTNDGDFANKIMHPSGEVRKTYRVEVDKEPLAHHIKQMERGVMLDDGKTSPAIVKNVAPNVLQITIHEGKNRIVRRILEKFGIQVRSLQRVRIGKLDLGVLPVGKTRTLVKKDLKLIFD